MLNESLVKYLAGLLDADGSLAFNFKPQRPKNGVNYTLTLMMKLTASRVVDKHDFVGSLPELTGLGYTFRWTTEEGREMVGWYLVRGSDLEKLLPRLVKHMVIKARHWQWLLEVWRARKQLPFGDKLLTPAECDALKTASKDSRQARVGPVKPKNHPTWAWVAGYLDGDGCYVNSPHKHRPGTNKVAVQVSAHMNDVCALEFLHKAFGGNIYTHATSPTCKTWIRNLGKSERSYALRFLPKLVRHSRLKRHRIEMMIHYHHQQRLSSPTPAGEAIV